MIAENPNNSIFPSLPVAVLDTDNLKCKEHSEIYKQNLENFTLWAHESKISKKVSLWSFKIIITVWDATAKSTAGVLRGVQFQLGHFEECLGAAAPFLTKYCLTNLEANIPKPKKSRDPLSLYHHPNEHVLNRLYVSNYFLKENLNIRKKRKLILAV